MNAGDVYLVDDAVLRGRGREQHQEQFSGHMGSLHVFLVRRAAPRRFQAFGSERVRELWHP